MDLPLGSALRERERERERDKRERERVMNEYCRRSKFLPEH